SLSCRTPRAPPVSASTSSAIASCTTPAFVSEPRKPEDAQPEVGAPGRSRPPPGPRTPPAGTGGTPGTAGAPAPHSFLEARPRDPPGESRGRPARLGAPWARLHR